MKGLKERRREKFIDSKGVVHNIPEIVFEEDEYMSLGKNVAESYHYICKEDALDIERIGDMYIYQDIDNPNIGYRIVSEFNNKYFNYEYEYVEKIEKFKEIQPKVKLTKFPTAVITKGGRVIGEEITFFPNGIDVVSYLKKYPEDYIILIRKMADIFVELAENGVLYTDIHEGNFIVERSSDGVPKVNLIDFDSHYLSFDYRASSTKMLFSNFELMINRIKKIVSNVNDNENMKKIK